jgi:hypothetical protein
MRLWILTGGVFVILTGIRLFIETLCRAWSGICCGGCGGCRCRDLCQRRN